MPFVSGPFRKNWPFSSGTGSPVLLRIRRNGVETLTANPDRPVWPVWMRHHAWNTRHARQSHAHAAPAPRPLPHSGPHAGTPCAGFLDRFFMARVSGMAGRHHVAYRHTPRRTRSNPVARVTPAARAASLIDPNRTPSDVTTARDRGCASPDLPAKCP